MSAPSIEPFKNDVPRLEANSFDFLRFAFASLVVFSHSFPLATGSEAGEPLVILTRGQLTLGTFAVDGFFMISGFLILHSWRSAPDAAQFLRKRILRIYPAFLVVALIDAFVITPAFSANGFQEVDPQFIVRFIGYAMRLIEITPGPTFSTNPAPNVVNGSLWSISFEFWCYLGVLTLGLLGCASAKRAFAGTLLASIAIAFLFASRHILLSGGIVGQIFGYPPFWARLLPFFLVGMTMYSYHRQIPRSGKGAALAGLALVLAAQVPFGLSVVLPIAGAYLVFWFAFLRLPALFNFARYGDFSYGIYLYAFPLLQIVVHFIGPVHPVVLFSVAWPLSICAAAGSWHLVEKYCIAFAHGRRRTPSVLRRAI